MILPSVGFLVVLLVPVAVLVLALALVLALLPLADTIL